MDHEVTVLMIKKFIDCDCAKIDLNFEKIQAPNYRKTPTKSSNLRYSFGKFLNQRYVVRVLTDMG